MLLIKRQFFCGTCLTSIKILFLSKLFSNWKIRKKLAGHKHKKVPDAKNKLKKKRKKTDTILPLIHRAEQKTKFLNGVSIYPKFTLMG